MKFLIFAASLRKESFNKKLASGIVLRAQAINIEMDLADFSDFTVPLYNQDLDGQESPAGLKNFVERLNRADGLVIVSPEYNYSIPGPLKNLVDWISRLSPMPLAGAKILLAGTSPSGAGAREALRQLKVPLEGLGSFVLPQFISVPGAMTLFDDKGQIQQEKTTEAIDKTLSQFKDFVQKLKGE